MRKIFVYCLLLFPFFCSAQHEKFSGNANTEDSSTKDKSYFEVATDIGNSYFSSKNQNLKAELQPSLFVISPSLSYYHKSGFGLTASTYFIHSGDSSGFYQYSLSPSYQVENDNIQASLSYTRYFVKKGYETIASPFKNEFYGQINLQKPWLQPGLSMGYSNGSYTEYNTIDTFILGFQRRFVDTVNTKLSTFSLSAFVQHEFDFYELLSSKDELALTPQFFLNAGSSQYDDVHHNIFYTRRGKKAIGTRGQKRLGRLNEQTPFQLESLGFCADAVYATGNFSIEPQLYLDYYLPATNSKRFTSIYTIHLSYDF
ncbi:MAG: hypothetical protein JSU03_03975 [Bacteroidetes bacterium]|nr:hypothetical protein [Bacteroidota bacterium]MBS1756412.1 hypothetical protein [Bacteroidota bacterium]